jgi:acetoacetyl-CoA synthetase
MPKSMNTAPDHAPIHADPKPSEGQLLWTPSRAFAARARINGLTEWLQRHLGLSFADYEALWSWSVSEPEAFWRAIWNYFQVISDTEPASMMTGETMHDTRWCQGSRTNYAEHVLRHGATAAPDEVAFYHSTEIRSPSTITWHELGRMVRALASRLRAVGIKPGDRIVSYMPNVPETAIAMLATTAIGAIWSAAAPEFGANTVVERFGQIQPKLAFVADGYSFNGRQIDRRAEVTAIAAALPSLETLVLLPYLGLERNITALASVVTFDEMLSGPEIESDAFEFERVASDHPLWILFSSGTTGRPKAIVHGHAGILLEQYKTLTFHCNLGPGQRIFFYTTTGWMMWNTVVGALVTGASAVLYDGSPVYGGLDMIWKMAADTGATMVGASPTLIRNMKTAGIRPGESYDLSRLEAIMLGGAPSSPETFAWLYDNVKQDLWVTSPSGGTEVCTAMVLGIPTRPVYAGEIQCRGLGMDVHVWGERGKDLIDAEGELVVTTAMPSAPLFFWGDRDGRRYHDSYYAVYTGVWHHGDRAKLNHRGGFYVYGRSDSTLNRFGVRIGSAELYRVIEGIAGILDSMVVCCETADDGYYMPLFVSLSTGLELDESLRQLINEKLRKEASPRHVPDEIHYVPAIPYTLTGKKMEVPTRKIVMGQEPDLVACRDAMANPDALNWFIDFAQRPDVVSRRAGKR